MRVLRACGVALVLVVTVSACSGGGSSGSATSPTVRSATTSPTPAGTGTTTGPSGQATGTARPGTSNPRPSSSAPLDLRPTVGSAPAPASAGGYAYVAPSRTALTAAAAAGRQYTQISTGRVVRGVTKAGHRIGDVVVFGLDKKFAVNPTFQGQVVNSLVTGMAGANATTSFESVGETGTEVASSRTALAMGWYSSGSVIVIVCAPKDLKNARSFVSAYPRAH